ncbi:MAG: hypothetical protein ACRCWO_13490, partial [Bosea sp. (in: a-proteobacteria)]
MLGLADRARIVDLFEMVAKGELARALDELRGQYDEGADPFTVMSELGGFIHIITRLKVTPSAAKDASLTDVERERGLAFANGLSIRLLSMLWQVLLKGLSEIKDSARPLAAAEMLLVRLCHAAELPTPDEALKALRDSGGGGGGEAASVQPASAGPSGGPSARMVSGGGGASPARSYEPARMPAAPPQAAAPRALSSLASFADLVVMAGEKRDLMFKKQLESDVRPVRFEEGRIEIALEPNASRQLVNQLSQKLQDWTGRPWMVVIAARETASDAAAPTMREIKSAEKAEERRKAAAHPVVQAALAQFPGASFEIVGRGQGAAVPEVSASAQGNQGSEDESRGERVINFDEPPLSADDLPWQNDEENWSPDPGLDPDD